MGVAVLTAGDILVVNAGSNSLKLRVVASNDQATAVDSLEGVRSDAITAVGHRIVHGGSRYRDPVLVDEAVRRRMIELKELAPLHNAPALAALDDARARFPHVPHVAVFDTGFHATIPPEAAIYAVPRAWREKWGVRRFGFHGLSVAWSAQRAAELLQPQPSALRLVVCHLGGGSSVTAVVDGRSVDTTMGFTPLEGVPMTTRSGSIDPGAVLHVLRRSGMTLDALENQLERESGLHAMTGTSGDVRDLEAAIRSGDVSARLPLDHLSLRVAGAVAAMAVSAGGIDALVFTAGIGENSSLVRAAVCDRLRFLGVRLEPTRNRDAVSDCDIADDDSPARILVVHAREELIAARLIRAYLG